MVVLTSGAELPVLSGWLKARDGTCVLAGAGVADCAGDGACSVATGNIFRWKVDGVFIVSNELNVSKAFSAGINAGVESTFLINASCIACFRWQRVFAVFCASVSLISCRNVDVSADSASDWQLCGFRHIVSVLAITLSITCCDCFRRFVNICTCLLKSREVLCFPLELIRFHLASTS